MLELHARRRNQQALIGTRTGTRLRARSVVIVVAALENSVLENSVLENSVAGVIRRRGRLLESEIGRMPVRAAAGMLGLARCEVVLVLVIIMAGDLRR